MGHTWPAGVPAADREPALDPTPAGDDNYPADSYGNAVARQAIGALGGGKGFWLTQSRVAGTEQTVYVENTNPVLAVADNEPANSTPLGGYKIDRANTPPWAYGAVFASPVTALRVGDLALFSVPGEPYPSIKVSLNQDVGARLSFIFGLAQDQLGYAEEVADYNGALQCSATDEWFFTISPIFGADVVRCSSITRRRSASRSPATRWRHTARGRSRRRSTARSSNSRSRGCPRDSSQPASARESSALRERCVSNGGRLWHVEKGQVVQCV